MEKRTFGELFQMVSEIRESLGAIKERCGLHNKILEGHTIALFGPDGTNGIVGQMARQFSSINSHDSRIKTLENGKEDIRKTQSKLRDKLIDACIGMVKLALLLFLILIVEHWDLLKTAFGI